MSINAGQVDFDLCEVSEGHVRMVISNPYHATALATQLTLDACPYSVRAEVSLLKTEWTFRFAEQAIHSVRGAIAP